MEWINGPFAFLSIVLVAIVFGFLVQRLLGLRLGWIRLLLGGLVALTVAQPVLNTLLDNGDLAAADAPAGPVLWLGLLAMLCAILAAMLFLVVSEAFVPFGSVPLSRIWGRGLGGWFRRTRRYLQILRLIVRHGLPPYLRGRRRRALATAAGRADFGRRLTRTLNGAGVTFVKIGQILATRRDLVPTEVVDELRSLQDSADTVPADDIRRIVETDLGGRIEDHFSRFDFQPLAAASVGQVHTAALLDGTEVVVKVQRPGILEQVEQDLDIAFRLTHRLEGWTEWAGPMGVSALADGLAGALREELDYRVEAANVLQVARSISAGSVTDVRVPQVYQALSGRRILVMERFDGVKLDEAGPLLRRDGIDPAAVARRVLTFLLHQVMQDGVFHADPHPGNIFVLEGGVLGFIDFGSVGRIDKVVRESLQRLMLGVDRTDPTMVADALLELVPRPEDVDQSALERDLGRFLAKYSGGSANSAQMFGDLLAVVSRHRLTIPAELATVFRVLGTVEGSLTVLDPEFDVMTESRAAATEMLGAHLGPTGLQELATEELLSVLPILRRLPNRVERIASATEHGRLTVNVRLFADARDRDWVAGIVQQVLIALLAAACGVMAVLLLGVDGGPMVTGDISLYALIAYNLLVLSLILALRVIAPMFRRRPPSDR